MSWKSLDQIYLQESAGKIINKLPRQLVNDSVEGKQLVKQITTLDKQNLLDPERDILPITRKLSAIAYTESINDYLESKNITQDTFQDINAKEAIINILTTNGDIQKYNNYISEAGILKLTDFSNGSLRALIENKGFSSETFLDLLNLIGTESGRGVGRGEVIMSCFFSDVSMMKGKGDLNWLNKYLEVKGSKARLGIWNRELPNFESTQLGQLAAEYKNTDLRIDRLVASLANIPNIDNKILLTSLFELIEIAYPYSSIPPGNNLNLTNIVDVRKYITKNYVSNYANQHDVSSFIFINTNMKSPRNVGRYITFIPSDISKLVDNNSIKTGVPNIADLDPQIVT